MKIAVAAELAPAKTLIPVFEKLDAEVIGLAHGNGAEELLTPYCSEIYSIGQGRGAGAQKRSNSKIGYLVMKDILKTAQAVRGKGIDLLITCGNAGDVRKGLSAANMLRIPTLHIEQDIYNPIEMIAFADVVTAPSKDYKNYLKNQYVIKNVKNIGGYPMVSFVDKMKLMDKNKIKEFYGVDEFILLALGGDLKGEQIPDLIKVVESLDKNILIAPFRFERDYIKSLISTSVVSKIKVLDGFVDLPSIMNASDILIYGAGMGITIEAGVLKVPSIKIAGFHHQHASVDLARKLGISVAKLENIPDEIENAKVPDGGPEMVKNAEKSVDNLRDIINDFKYLKKSKSGFSSLKKIWNARSEFR
jgi:UDP-N-acetylglucosamine:LPS N-acetylglucosamine transferase